MPQAKATHVFLEPCIVEPLGSVEAGTEISSKQVDKATWNNLILRGIVKSMEELKAEADAKEEAEAEEKTEDKQPAV